MAWDAGLIFGVAGTVLGGIAIAVATPPFIQMIWGRPTLDISTDEYSGADGKNLLVTIKNKIITNKFLKLIGVEREVGSVNLFFDIQEQGTGKFIAKDMTGVLSNTATRENRALIAQAHPAFTIGAWLILHKDSTPAVIIDGSTSATQKTIPEGDYTANVTVIRSGRSYEMKRNFKVGSNQRGTFWVG